LKFVNSVDFENGAFFKNAVDEAFVLKGNVFIVVVPLGDLFK
jgi:hypothetical protein